MIRAQTSLDIARPPADVFQLVVRRVKRPLISEATWPEEESLLGGGPDATDV